jgi:hypothetical protein
MAGTALVVVDMLNTYEHEDAEALTRSVREVLPNVAHIHQDLAEAALRMMEINMRAEIVAAADCVR